MWAAIRYRRGQALVLLALAALITGCAVLAPLYHRAMRQALTRSTVDTAPAGATAVQLRSISRFTYGQDAAEHPPAGHDALAGLFPAEARAWFGPRVDGASVIVTRADRTGASPLGPLQWRDGACEHVEWLAGGCPRGRGDIAVSAADRDNFRLAVGSAVAVVEQPAVDRGDPLPTVPLRVTGVYRQLRGPYWDDLELAGVSGSISRQPPYRPLHDTWLTAPATFGTGWLDPANSVTYDLDRRVGVDEVTRAGPLVAGIAELAKPQYDVLGEPADAPGAMLAEVQSELPAIAATIEEGRRHALVTVPLLMIQLGLLALFVLGLTLGAAVEQRRPEVAVARLRGAGRPAARRLVLAELLPVVLAGVPIGTALALGLAAVAGRTVLPGRTAVEPGVAFWAAVAGSAVLLAAVTWAAVAAGTRDSVIALLRTVPTRAPTWRLGAADAVVIAGAGVAVLAFATGDLDGPLALAAPALLALIAGLLLAHAIVPVATWAGRRLTARGTYGAALALLGVARRPATRRVVTVVTVASALLVFSAYAVSVGARNRQLAAERDVGAAMVAELTGTDVPAVRAAVAGAGGGATTVVRVAASENAFRTTLAVEPEFARIALFPGADPAAVPWSRLRVPTGRPLALTGRSVSFRVTAALTGPGANLRLQLLSAGTVRTVQFGPVPPDGPAVLRGAVPCAAGCTVVGLSVATSYGKRSAGRLVLDRLRVAGGTTDLPGTAADWRAEGAAGTRVADAPGGLALDLDSDGTTAPVLTSRFFPPALPAVLVGGSTGQATGSGLGGTDRPLAGVAALPRAPGLPGAAALVDLDLLQHWGSRAGESARVQVWFDSEDPSALARVTAALDRAGVEVAGVRRLSAARAGYAASVPAWSLQLGVLAAVAGLLLAGLVLVLLVASTWRRRSRDLACLAMGGTPRRALRRVAIGEQLPVVLLAVLAGGGCGLLGAVLALPTVPLFARPPEPSTVDLSVPWVPVLAVLAAALVVLGLVAALCGSRLAAAGGRLSRVREAL